MATMRMGTCRWTLARNHVTRQKEMDVTEKWLSEIGGWQVMKAARGLVDAGLAAVSSAEGELIRGVAGSGKMKFTTGLRIRSGSDVENLCTCPQARRSGMMCEHALAVALMHARGKIGATGSSSAASKPDSQTSPKPVSGQIEARTEPLPKATVPGRFSIYLPEALMAGQAHPPFAVFVKFEAGGESETSTFVSWLAGQGIQAPQSMPLSLQGEMLSAFLQSLAEHPRVFAGRPNGRESPIQIAAEPVRLPVSVQMSRDQWICLELASTTLRQIWDAWWICQETGVLFRHPSDQPLVGSLVTELCRSPATRPLRWLAEHGERLAECLQMDLRGGGLEHFHVSPVPCQYEIHLEGSLQALEARVLARFGGHQWPAGSPDLPESYQGLRFPIQDQLSEFIFYVQDVDGESRLLRLLETLGFRRETPQAWRLKGEENILRFHSSDLPELRRQVEIVEGERWHAISRSLHRITPKTRLEDDSGHPGGGDWLSMEFAYEASDGFRLPRAEVLRLIRSGRRSLQSHGKRYVLDVAAVENFEEALSDVPLELNLEGARVRRMHAAYFGGGDAGVGQTLGEDELRAGIGELAGMLRPYQMEGVLWMTSRVLQGRGGVLADEMGLGKTVQSIALALFVKRHRNLPGPVLIVCPKSLLENWQAEIERFAPCLTTVVAQGTKRENMLEQLHAPDVIITSYQLIIRDIQYYQSIDLSLILLDEASFIRNPDTDAAKALCGLKATGRIALTGTPLENGVRDLWSIFHFALPGYLGGHTGFRERFEAPIKAGLELPAGQAAALRLQKLTRPYFLRRTKRQVLKDLPEKIEQVLWCGPSPIQAEVYQKILEEGRDEIRMARRRAGQNGAKMTMFTVLLRLRQACCDLRLTGVQAEALSGLALEDYSGKWAALEGQLETALQSGGKVLIFSQFVHFLRLVRDQMRTLKVDHAYLDGSSQDRAAQVKRFQQDPCCKVFLISLKAGGYGLNLTAADSVILADPWWNPAVEAQAIDRAHRIGQQKVVNAYRLVIRGTVEERILKLQTHKRGLAEATLNDQTPLMEGLNEAELEDLLRG
ncbi:MAG: SNF2-related protein [Verrucomicrobiaceae bacterium]